MAVIPEPAAETTGVSRRDFLRVGGLSVLGLPVSEQLATQRALAEAHGKGGRRCLLILLTGGAGPLETFDPKPLAPAEIRGPYKPIATATAGMYLSETLPQLAALSSKFVLVRSLMSEAAPIHEAGLQLLQTGRLKSGGTAAPSVGSIVSRLLGPRGDQPAYAVLPKTLGPTGVSAWQGQGAGFLGAEYEPAFDDCGGRGEAGGGFRGGPWWAAVEAESEAIRRSYGDSEFGRACLRARQLLEKGTRFVTVNMFDSLTDRLTWDCHGYPGAAPATVADYGSMLCPELDRVVSSLLTDLEQRGLLEETLVVVAGEFGRTPRMNSRGGRDHWCGVWSALLAGAGVAGGRVLGASDARGGVPADHPLHSAQLAATMLHSLGIDLTAQWGTPTGGEFPVAVFPPLTELWG